jgi:hypothetical protein
MKGDREVSIRDGMDSYIRKPVKNEELKEIPVNIRDDAWTCGYRQEP